MPGYGSKYRVGPGYEYSVLCQSCGLRYKASQIRQRWDGLYVCPEDYEIRHPLDFFRTRNDVHKLPFVLSDSPADPMATWIPTINNITYNNLDGETGTTILALSSPTGYYYADSLVGKTFAKVYLPFYKPSFSDSTKLLPVLQALSTTSGSSADITCPTTPTTAGTFTVINDRGELVKKGNVTAGNLTVTLGTWAAKRGGITIAIEYGT